MPADLAKHGERSGAAALIDVEPRPGVGKPDPILVADGVTRRFGGLTAVEVEHFEVQRGAITALIGPNGAGKTTFFNLLTGFDKPNEGSWSFEGKDLGGTPAYRVARRGMVRTFQLTKALSRMTVLDNMRLGATDQRGENFFRALLPGSWRGQQKQIDARARDLLARFKLDSKESDLAGSLSGGQRKLLEMARSLMVEPTLVMLDEPMAGVNPALTQSLLGHVKDLREQGMTVLFVEHDMDMVRDISDWVVVMAQGKIVAEGPPAVVMADQAVIDAYLGAHHDAPLDEADEQAQVTAGEAELATDRGDTPAGSPPDRTSPDDGDDQRVAAEPAASALVAPDDDAAFRPPAADGSEAAQTAGTPGTSGTFEPSEPSGTSGASGADIPGDRARVTSRRLEPGPDGGER